jgi:hypothetical protein
MLELIAGLNERCNKYKCLETIRTTILQAKSQYRETKKQNYLEDIKMTRYALDYVVVLLGELGVFSTAEEQVVRRYYGCYERELD